MIKKITYQRKNQDGVITHFIVDGVENTREEVYNKLLNHTFYAYIQNGSETDSDDLILVHRVLDYITIHPIDNTKDDLGDVLIY